MSDFSPCFLIPPCYNHGDTVAKVTQSLKAFSYPIILVNDGSDQYTSSALNELAKQDDIHLLTLKKRTKGKAVPLSRVFTMQNPLILPTLFR